MPAEQVNEKKEKLEDLVMYWHISFWDLPLEGVAMYRDSPVYFKLIEDEEDDDEEYEQDQDHVMLEEKTDEPTYALHALTEAQYRELEAQHEEFGRLVGRHTDHRPGIYAPYTTTENDTQGTSRVQQWYESAANWKLSFSPTRHCPRVAIVPWSAFANYHQPTTTPATTNP
jgi:hypothetical protein